MPTRLIESRPQSSILRKYENVQVSFKGFLKAPPDERSGVLKLPSHHIAPLIDFERKITMTTNPFRENRIHYSFTGGPNGNRLFKVRISRFRHPGNLPIAKRYIQAEQAQTDTEAHE